MWSSSAGRTIAVAKTGELFNRYGNGSEGLKTAYGYDDRSQLTSEQTKVGATTTVLTGRDDAHAYDVIGNRSSVTHNSSTSTYNLNSLNQYTQRTVPGVFDVAGAAGTGATVTVNSSSAGVTRHGEYFFKGQGMANNPNPVYSSLAVSDGTTTTNLPAFTAGTPEALSYDLDGNLTSDGRWTYVYNAENRILWMETATTAVAAGHPKVGFYFFYDYLGRRVRKVEENWNGSGWVAGTDRRFIYHGWNEVAEFYGAYNGGNFPTPNVRHHFWGLDLSGTMQGAGGVGGLLMTWEPGQTYLPMYDALGNVHGMIKAADGTIAAAYEYDAFGNTLRESGTYAASNPFRFSTKYTDIETGLVYYGLRYYSPTLGRFINQDPIEEQGGLNLYAFCGNNGVNRWDFLGQVEQTGEGTASSNDPDSRGFFDWLRSIFGGGGGSNISVGMSITAPKMIVTAPRGDTGGRLGNANDRSALYVFNSTFSPGTGLYGQDSFGYGGSAVPLDPFHVTGTRTSAPDLSATYPTINISMGDVSNTALLGAQNFVAGGAEAVIGTIQGTVNTIIHPIDTVRGVADGLGTSAYYTFTNQGRADLGDGLNYLVNTPEGAQQLSRGVGAVTVILAGTIVTGRPSSNRGLATNPFNGRTPQQIHEYLIEQGFKPSAGADPVAGFGGYINPRNGRSYHLDPANRFGEPPHIDVNHIPKNTRYLPKKKYDIEP